MSAELTARQRQVLGAVRDHIETSGYPPTLAELGERLGIRNPNGVRAHLVALQKKGYIDRASGASRGIAVRGWTRVLDATLGRLRGRHRSASAGVLGRVTYHLAWTTRGARPLLGEAEREAVAGCVRQVCAEHGWEVHGLEVRPELVRLALSVDPEHSAGAIVNHMQWYAALLRLGRLHRLGVGKLWGAGYAAAGGAKELGRLIPKLVGRQKRAHR